MIFKVDGDLPVELVEDLRRSGHTADSVLAEGIAGTTDMRLLDKARKEGRVPLTMDKGMADIRGYPPEEYCGIVLIRPGVTGRRAILDFVREHLSVLLRVPLTGRLVVVSKSGVRVR